jgi:hypothetical protein
VAPRYEGSWDQSDFDWLSDFPAIKTVEFVVFGVVELHGPNIDAPRVMEVAERRRGWLPEVKVVVRKQVVKKPELENYFEDMSDDEVEHDPDSDSEYEHDSDESDESDESDYQND